MGEHHIIVHVPIHLFGINLSITNFVVMLFVAAGLTFLFLAGAARALRPTGEGRFPNLVESLMGFVRENVSDACLGEHGAEWFPFVATVFFFILFGNLLGLVPVPGYFHAATSNLNVTAVMALVVFLVVQGVALKHHGIKFYLAVLFPKSAPAVLRYTLMPPIELIGILARPFSLAIRLFANMTAGHVVVLALVSMIFTFASWWIMPGPVVAAVGIMMLELFVAFLQAFVFTLLVSVFIGQIRESAH